MPNAEADEQKRQAHDLLDIAYINSLPQPLWDGEWPVYDIDVRTGLYRIDVCGLLDMRHIGECIAMKDSIGRTHCVDDFYLEQASWKDRQPLPEPPKD